MSALDRIASALGRKDHEPNKELAQGLVAVGDSDGIREIVTGLQHPAKAVRCDCLKVLAEVGLVQPTMVKDYADDLLVLLFGKDNRLVWASMIVLGAIAPLRAELLCSYFDAIAKVIAQGSVITRDHGVKVMAALAVHAPACRECAFDFILAHLASCRAQDVPQDAESTMTAVNAQRRLAFANVLKARLDDFSAPQLRRVERILAKIS